MKRRRLSASAWVLIILGGIVVLVGVEAASRMLRTPPLMTNIARPQLSIKVGEPAPDFALPDRTGVERRLSQLVRRDTILCFACGCANCLDLQTYTAMLLKKMGAKAPDVISVSTMPKEREETWFRDTGLKQKILYEPKKGPIMAKYHGDPCPRVYRLKPDRTVTWIGPSPADMPFMKAIGDALAQNLGFPVQGGPQSRG